MNSYLRKTILKNKKDILRREFNEFKNLDEQFQWLHEMWDENIRIWKKLQKKTDEESIILYKEINKITLYIDYLFELYHDNRNLQNISQ
jgi:hypothetical protein